MVADTASSIVEWMLNLGHAGAFVVVAIYIVSCIAMIPTLILASASGYVLGFFLGAASVSAGVVLGGAAAFLIGRHWVRGWVFKKIAKKPILLALEDAVSREGWRIVLLARLCPIIPFRLSNYAFSVTHIPFHQYLLATWLGTIPSAVFYAYLGHLAEDLSDLHLIGARSPMEWIFHISALILLLVNIIYISRLTKKALAKHL